MPGILGGILGAVGTITDVVASNLPASVSRGVVRLFGMFASCKCQPNLDLVFRPVLCHSDQEQPCLPACLCW